MPTSILQWRPKQFSLCGDWSTCQQNGPFIKKIITAMDLATVCLISRAHKSKQLNWRVEALRSNELLLDNLFNKLEDWRNG
jgi:hypothetical protein